MIFIDDVLVSEELFKKNFVCNLNACKGACCWEGDFGAPVTDEEISQISEYKEEIGSLISESSRKVMQSTGGFVHYAEAGTMGTALMPDGSCVFLTQSEMGIAQCAIQKAHTDGLIPVNKPISCHLYPIRVTRNEAIGFEAWNYDEWDICSAACSLGDELKVPIYKFLKTAIVRYKGEDFYEALEEAVDNQTKSD